MATVDLEAIDRDFYLAYGRAMGAWAELETALGTVFIAITKLENRMAVDLFNSARSFQGRADMVRAVIPFAKTIPAGLDFLDRATNLAANYVQVRNRMAHDYHSLEISSDDPPIVKRSIVSLKGAEIDIAHMERVRTNLSDLAWLIRFSLGQTRLLRDAELSLAALRLMPSDAADARKDPSEASTRLAQLIAVRE